MLYMHWQGKILGSTALSRCNLASEWMFIFESRFSNTEFLYRILYILMFPPILSIRHFAPTTRCLKCHRCRAADMPHMTKGRSETDGLEYMSHGGLTFNTIYES